MTAQNKILLVIDPFVPNLTQTVKSLLQMIDLSDLSGISGSGKIALLCHIPDISFRYEFSAASSLSQVQNELKNEAIARIRECIKTLNISLLSCLFAIGGSLRNNVYQAVEQLDLDLILIQREKKRRFSRWVSQQILSVTAPCDVLFVENNKVLQEA